MIDPDRMAEFLAELNRRKFTISGFMTGKESLNPAIQIPVVDALWRQWFPESPTLVCPLFSHFNDQYQDSTGFPDVMPVRDVPATHKANRVIVARPHWEKPDRWEAEYMISDDVYNGVNWMKTWWDGSLGSALADYRERISGYQQEYAEKIEVRDDWLAVTVDYHS
jgi:hypothetical protein